MMQPMMPHITPCGNVTSKPLAGPRCSRTTADFVISTGFQPCAPVPPAPPGPAAGVPRNVSSSPRKRESGAVAELLPAAPSSAERGVDHLARALRIAEQLLHVRHRMLGQQSLDHRGLGLPRRIDADLDLPRRAVEHPLRRGAKSRLQHDKRRTLRPADHRLGFGAGRAIDREVAGRFERRDECARPVAVVLVDHDDPQWPRVVALWPENTNPNRMATMIGQTKVKKSPDLTRTSSRRSLPASARMLFISPSSCGLSDAGTPARAWRAPCETS